MSLPIIQFQINPLNTQGNYTLVVKDNGLVASEINFIQTEQPTALVVHDLATVNGTTEKRKLSHFIRRNHPEELSSSVTGLDENGERVFVLDLRHSLQAYLPAGRDDIEACEKLVLDFLRGNMQGGGNALAFRTLIQTHRISHVIRESMLKTYLIEHSGFSETQVEFFLNNSEGKQIFCQFAEFFMNAFKLGQMARFRDGYEFQRGAFIEGIEQNASAFIPAARSVVFFPPEYAGVEKNYYAQAIRNSGIFHLDFDYCSANITKVTITKSGQT